MSKVDFSSSAHKLKKNFEILLSVWES